MSRNSESENTCVVCFKNVDVYSIGYCDHPVCHECSTRMRVLCRQTECPICRQDMSQVIFVYKVKPFSELQSKNYLRDEKFKICFENNLIQEEFYNLLRHCCSKCSDHPVFKNFTSLKEHMRREHELHYCDLCTDNLKIFTSERKCYTRKQLAQHRRQGDDDNKSHRGHPLCEFCDERYMDNDELFRHLRRDHLYCHFCDADGQHLYYSSYEDLLEHFRAEHYICEEGTCIDEKFTAVFRSEIDLRAHKANVHYRTMGKAATKQARTLELEFTLKPRPRAYDYNKRGRTRNNGQENSREEEGECSSQDELNVQTPNLNELEEFPSLAGHKTNSNNSAPLTNIQPSGLTIHTVNRRVTPLAVTDENFPALADNHHHTQSTSVRLNINQDRGGASSSGSTAAGPKPTNLSIHVNRRPAGNSNGRAKINNDDFPALSGMSSREQPARTTKWVPQVSQKQQPQPTPTTTTTAATAMAAAAPALSMEQDFPSLAPKHTMNINFKTSEPPKSNFVSLKKGGGGGKKASSVTISVKHQAESRAATAVTTQLPDNSLKRTKKKKNKNVEDSVKKKQEERRGGGEVEEVVDIGRVNISQPAPPPGFSSAGALKKPPPPPGFNPLTRPSNGLTFTNSSGESYSIPAATVTNTSRQSMHTYTPPDDFHARNQNLVTRVNQILLDQTHLEQFRLKSSMFRQGRISGEEYIRHCVTSMGDVGFCDLFPELLALLPDINKQQELFGVYKSQNNNNNKFTGGGGKKKLICCDKCNQVLLNCDLKRHLAAHVLDNNFPTLH